MIVPASPAHIGRIASKMRAMDVKECAAMGFSPKQALRHSLMASGEAWTAMVNGVPEAMFGLVVKSALTGEGSPWMLGSEEIYQQPRAMLKFGPVWLNRWLDSTSRLSNIVSIENSRAIRMLRRWGFDVGEEVIIFAGTGFVTFSLER